MIRKLTFTAMLLLVASVSWAVVAAQLPLETGAVPVTQPPVELDRAQTQLLEKAADPSTDSLSAKEIELLNNTPAIQNVGWACCLGDCWEAWGVCLDACPDGDNMFQCRQACHAERDACKADCGQPGF